MRRNCWIVLAVLLVVSGMLASGEDHLVRLFNSSYDFWDCDSSPDGRFMALAGKMHDQPAEKARIWFYSAGAKDPVLWTNTDAYCDDWPRWSPDGSTLVLVRRELATQKTCLWLKDVASGAGRRLTDGPDDRQPSWSPDGKFIVFRRGLGPTQSVLAVFSLATGKIFNLPTPNGLLGEPFWGSDGVIYYTRYEMIDRQTSTGGRTYTVQVIGSGRLWFYNTGTGQDGPLLSENFDQCMPALSRDGRWLAFYGQKEGGTPSSIPDPKFCSLFVRDQSTGRLYDLVGDVDLTRGPPSWSADGTKITFYSLRQERPALWSCALADSVAAP